MPHSELSYSSDQEIDAADILTLKSALPLSCFFSLALNYNSGAYVTSKHEVFA